MTFDSVLTWEAAAALRNRWAHEGKRVVFTNGCFDILHAGHVSLLAAARAEGDVLIVALNSDASVRRLKGDSRPINPVEDRAFVLAALRSVDAVVVFDDDTPARIIELLHPDVLVKGGDYTEESIVGAPFVKAKGGRVAIIPLVAGRATTAVVQKIRSLG